MNFIHVPSFRLPEPPVRVIPSGAAGNSRKHTEIRRLTYLANRIVPGPSKLFMAWRVAALLHIHPTRSHTGPHHITYYRCVTLRVWSDQAH